MLALEKSPEEHDYILISTTREGSFEREINDAAAKGYRLLPLTMAALQKSAGMLGNYGYETAVVMECFGTA